MTVAPIAPLRRRTCYSTRKLARRWGKSEPQVRLLLGPLEETGYLERRGDGWRATDRAAALHLDGDPV
jgi:DNA-binding IclR family transcriptional regulator